MRAASLRNAHSRARVKRSHDPSFTVIAPFKIFGCFSHLRVKPNDVSLVSDAIEMGK